MDGNAEAGPGPRFGEDPSLEVTELPGSIQPGTRECAPGDVRESRKAIR